MCVHSTWSASARRNTYRQACLHELTNRRHTRSKCINPLQYTGARWISRGQRGCTRGSPVYVLPSCGAFPAGDGQVSRRETSRLGWTRPARRRTSNGPTSWEGMGGGAKERVSVNFSTSMAANRRGGLCRLQPLLLPRNVSCVRQPASPLLSPKHKRLIKRRLTNSVSGAGTGWEWTVRLARHGISRSATGR